VLRGRRLGLPGLPMTAAVDRLSTITQHISTTAASAAAEEPPATYRVAILGCRGRGTAAARGYAAHPRVEMVALCDLVPDVLNSLGDELGVDPSKRFDDLDDMMAQAQPDIVAIPVATELHYSLWWVPQRRTSRR